MRASRSACSPAQTTALGGEVALLRVDRDAAFSLGEAGGFDAGEHCAVRLEAGGHIGHGPGGAPEVDDARAGYPQSGDCTTMGLDVLHGLAVDALEALNLVLHADPVDLLEHGEFVLGGGGDDLAADVVVHPVFLGEGDELMASLDAVDGLEAAGWVVQATVDHAAVVARLVVAEDGFLFEEGNLGVGVAALQFEQGRGADDAAAHHDEVELAL